MTYQKKNHVLGLRLNYGIMHLDHRCSQVTVLRNDSLVYEA